MLAPNLSCKSAKRIIKTIAVTGIALNVCGCSTYVPPEAISPPAKTFASGISTFSDGVTKEHLNSYRRNLRNDYFVAMLRDYLETPNESGESIADEKTVTTLLGSSYQVTYLCHSRYQYQVVNGHIENLNATGSAITSRLATSSNDIGTLLANMGKSYSIKIDATNVPSNYDAWLVAEDGKQCKDSVSSGNPFATRSNARNEIALAAAWTAVETIWGILKPVAVAGLQTVDEERRNAAIKEFFSDQKNVDKLKVDIQASETYIKTEFDLAQVKSAGQAAFDSAQLFDISQPHWVKIRSIAKSSECKTALVNLGKKPNDPKGTACLNSALEAASAVLKKSLDSADAFDASSEQKLPKELLSSQLQTLVDAATGKQTDEKKLENFWATLQRYDTLYKTVEIADSAANKKKVSDAVAAFEKALK